MNKKLSTFLQILTILFGLAVLTFLIWEPTGEGVNANKTLFEIYFKDPFLAYAYIGSIAFFVALYQAIKALRYYSQNKIAEAVKALATIKYSLIIFIAFVWGGMAYIFLTVRGKDDIAGGMAIGVFVTLISLGMLILATKFSRVLKNKII